MNKRTSKRFLCNLIFLILLTIVFTMGFVSINTAITDFAKKVGLEDSIRNILPDEQIDVAYAASWNNGTNGTWPTTIGNTGTHNLNNYGTANWYCYMSDGAKKDYKSTASEVIIDQGSSSGNRDGYHEITVNFNSEL